MYLTTYLVRLNEEGAEANFKQTVSGKAGVVCFNPDYVACNQALEIKTKTFIPPEKEYKIPSLFSVWLFVGFFLLRFLLSVYTYAVCFLLSAVYSDDTVKPRRL